MVGSVFGRWLLLVMAIVVGLFGLIVAGGYWRLSSSLPRLTGEVKAPVTAAVSVHRDADGVPTIVAQTEPDMAFALGFLHAQERYFQMDLLRRAGTGELAALLGSSVVAIDRSRRRHRFRWRAQQAIERLSAPERAVIFAYTAGVRAGLADLSAPPFEYDLLGVTPEPWQEEDAYCVSLAMFFTLQDASGANELRRAAIERALSPRLAELALSPGTKWDAAIDNSLLSLPSWSNTSGVPVQEAAPPSAKPAPDAPPPPGSNNWAVSGRFSTHGGAMVADDMHLRLRMPNIWFRARYRIEDDEPFDSTGVTLPGTPLIIAGSNGHIAWGFTNAFIDTSDLVVIERGSSPETYRTPDGEAKIERFEEKIEIRGEPAQTLVVKETIWGPIVGRDFDGRQVALRWTAHDLRGNNLGLRKLGRARTLEEAIAAAQAAGMPNQNVALAAKDGRIAWTISGLVPARPPGCDGARPTSWADGRCAWRGYAPPSEVP
ncbi:MAG: penicillin acylase family protein, partial [Myxococcota bacterium]